MRGAAALTCELPHSHIEANTKKMTVAVASSSSDQMRNKLKGERPLSTLNYTKRDMGGCGSDPANCHISR